MRRRSSNPAQGEALIRLAGCGHEQYGSTHYYYDASRRQDRPHATLQLTLRGTGFYRSAGTQALLPAGRAFFAEIPGPFEYGFAPGSAAPHELVFVSFHGPAAMQWYRSTTARFGPVMDF